MSTEDLPNMKKKRKKSMSNPRSPDAALYSPPPLPRWLSSLPSTVSSFGEESDMDICRICHGESDEESLVAPCYCAGTLRYVHQSCLQQWIKSSNIRRCELCNFQFIMHTKTKPFRKWEQLDMSPVERRKLLCSLAFHVVALMCVVWSIYVLIERTVEEVRAGALEWTFWTKIIVLAIGFTGGFVFMYVQCRVYAQLFWRWRSLNRVIYLEDAPEKLRKPQQLPQSPQQPASDVSSLDQPVPVTGGVQANEDKCTSPDEDQFHSCMSESSTSCSGGSSNNISAHSSNDKNINTTPVAAGAGSSKTTLTSIGDNLAPTSDHHSLTEVVVMTNVTSSTQQEPVLLKEIQIKGSSS